MIIVLLACLTSFSTLLGGLFAFWHRDRLHRILGFSAGIILGVIAFDVLPEIAALAEATGTDFKMPMVALVVGFLVVSHRREAAARPHRPRARIRRWASPPDGWSRVRARACGAQLHRRRRHRFGVPGGQSPGLRSRRCDHRPRFRRWTQHRVVDVEPRQHASPVHAPASPRHADAAPRGRDDAAVPRARHGLADLLGVFAGFLLYIGASDILPEAHAGHASLATLALTVAGTGLMYLVSGILP